jgi:integrase
LLGHFNEDDVVSPKVRLPGRLSARALPGLLKRLGTHCDGRGLNLVVTDKGASWQFRFMLNGRARTMGLGSAIDVTLATAREAAAGARALKAQGIDPIKAREAGRAAARAAPGPITFGEAAQRYFDRFRPQWRSSKHAQQWQATMLGRTMAGKPTATDYTKALRAMLVAEVDKDAVKDVLEPIWFDRTHTANRILERVRQVLDFAIANDSRPGPNPASHDVFKSLFPTKSKIHKVRHFAALPFEDMPEFMRRLRATEGTMARALEFTILTAVRTNETIGARWREINLDAKVWAIPAARMKMAEDHRVPLSQQAVALLRARRGEDVDPNASVFATSTGHTIGPEEQLKVVKKLGYAVTVHGMRSCFSDWAFHRTDHTFMEVEISLAHKVGGKVHEAYRRRDLFERRAVLMARWADYLDGAKPADITKNNVIPMQVRA